MSKGDRNAGPTKEIQRGTQDELEIMRLIVLQTPGLKQAVLDKLRQAKGRLEARRPEGLKPDEADDKNDERKKA